MNKIDVCCAECGKEGGVSLKACKSCMQVKYCNAICQKNHWPKHKKLCKEHATKLRDDTLFKDPPAKEDCPICFLPMPARLICCILLPPATISSVPIYNFAIANLELAAKETDNNYPCCGKSICRGCIYSFHKSGNLDKCPFCNSDQGGKTDEEMVREVMKRVEVNDAASFYLLANSYHDGVGGIQPDQAKAMEIYVKAANLGSSKASYALGNIYYDGGDSKKAKFHFEAAAMAGDKVARINLGIMETRSGNVERGFKHWIIAASAGEFDAMNHLQIGFEKGLVSRDTMDSTLKAYNNSCVEMRSEARDAFIRGYINSIDAG